MSKPPEAPREPQHLTRTWTEHVHQDVEFTRTVTHHWIERDWRLVAALALIVGLPPLVQGLMGDVGGAAITLGLGLAGTIVGYFAVTKRTDRDTA
jgi:hypothetical protein